MMVATTTEVATTMEVEVTSVEVGAISGVATSAAAGFNSCADPSDKRTQLSAI